MPTDRHINYIELPSTDLAATKQFYTGVFGWKFTDWGPDYVGFGSGVPGPRFSASAAVPR